MARRCDDTAGRRGALRDHELPLDDRERLGLLLSELEPRLRAVALRITRHPEAAGDAVQNAFEKVLRYGDQFQGQARVSTWLHRIVANEALMWLRAERRRREVQADVATGFGAVADRDAGPSEQLQRRERAARLRVGLGRLPADERDVMLHCGLASETYAAYGARTGAHPGAVKSRAFRARCRLRTLLADTSA